MPYIMINGEEEHYEANIMPFITQNGYSAIRFIGDNIPETDKGFKLYDDEDSVISDFSEYKFIYRPNEYAVAHDQIIYSVGSDQPLGPSAYDRLNSRVNRVSSQVEQLTPYEETKKAYYGENEKTFYYVPEGNITVFFDNYEGEYEIIRIENRLVIKFPNRLLNTTNITIVVSK